jgi:Tol biopolymer transport system component/DNA-binding winged helix-turn-helix (wHTH) protein
MSLPADSHRQVRLGEFELDFRTAELRNNGQRFTLQGQPFQVLTVLLEYPGELVTREELKKRLWPSDTFVDFDQSLNKAVNRLRQALDDSAEHPRFIETLPRRGYRFIGAVQTGPPETGIADLAGEAAPIDQLLPVESGAAGRTPMLFPFPVRIGAVMVALVVLVGVGAIAIWLKSPISPPRIVGSKQITNDGVPKIFFLVSDGARIYFNEVSSGRITLNQVSTAGGETAIINTSVPDPVVEDISPDQSQLLVQPGKGQWDPEGSDFWLVPIPTGSARRLEGIIGRWGTWVPARNGKFYFVRGKDIYVADHDGSNPHKIATAPGVLDYLQCSPDGSRLRFMIFDLGKSAFSTWEVRSDGSGMHPLLPDWSDPPGECCGRWTPDGRYYFFESVREISNLWMMPERNSLFRKTIRRPVQLTAGPLSFYYPISSKDGKQLYVMGEHARAQLVRYERKSGNFVPFMGGISAGEVDFSRDGKWMAYVSYPDGLLWSSELEGGKRVQLTFPPAKAASVRWSPDGQQIVFSSLTPGGAWRVLLISRDGGAPQELTRSSDVAEVAPDWSPDGKTLAFASYVPGQPDQSSIQLFDLKTRQASRLPGSKGVSSARWSPNGRYLIGAPVDGKKLELFDFKTKKWRDLIANVGTIGYFSWSSDSAYVYFDNLFTNDPAYLRLRISDSKLERIASLKDIQRSMWNLMVPWSGLAPGEIPLFVRNISTQEIYALDLQIP